MLPWDFWRMTPAELADLADGALRRERAEWGRAAWMVAYLLKPHLKRGRNLKPEQLLPKGFLAPKKKPTARRKDDE